MAITFVHSLGSSAVASQQAAPITLSAVSTTQFNTVIVRCHSAAGNNVTQILDSQGNTYYPAQPSTAAAATAEIWWAVMLSPLVAGNTITVYFETSQAGTAAAADEFAGIITAGPLDVTAEASSATTSVTAGATDAASVTGALVVTAAGASTTGTWTYPGGSYTNFSVPGSTVAYQGAWQVAAGTGGFSATWHNASAATMEAVIAVFDPAPAVGNRLFPIPYVVELLAAGTWNDITGYVYTRDGITITGGKSDSTTATPDPATCTMTLDNRDGRFSPLYTGGAFYPNMTRNMQLRVSVANAVSSSGNTYSGYRFWGTVPDWPPLSDISGSDVYVQITASGPLRQIKAGGGKGSALTRYYQTLTGSYAPVAYWPCEEDPDTTQIGAGIEGGSNMSITQSKGADSPTWKAVMAFDGSTPVPVINYSTWDGLTGSFGTSGNDVFSIPGTYQWLAGVSSVDCRVTGGGGGAENGWRGSGGGGGELARESTLAVTPGVAYTVTVGAGGQGGAFSSAGKNSNGQAGGQSSFAGDSVTVTGHGGKGGTSSSGGVGGSGSGNSVHHSGGAGAANPNDYCGGAGGGSSGGTSAAGNNGSGPSSNNVTPGAGGAAVAGGGAGGPGGQGGTNPQGGHGGGGPGGGGGGGGDDVSNRALNHGGGNGGDGQVELIYTPASSPTTNVIRWVMQVPVHGGNPGKVLMRIYTGSANLSHLDVTYAAGGKLRLQGFTSGSVQTFDTGAQSWNLDGQPAMISVELVNSGTGVAWAFRACNPGPAGGGGLSGTSGGGPYLIGSATGTLASTQVGNVSEVVVSPDADISQTAVAHISVQYALIPVLTVAGAIMGHSQEVSIDRFIRLAGEQALDNAPQFSETADHWGFENGAQGWTAINGSVASSSTTIAGQWPTDGTNSLKLTANGSGNPSATSPTGTSGEPAAVGDIVSVAADVMAPTALAHIYVGIKWWQSTGSACAHAEDDLGDVVLTAGTAATLKVTAAAPATAAYFSVTFGDHNTDANSTLMYIDNVRVTPQMGPQTAKAYHTFLEEIEDLDQGILKEAKALHGLGYVTRIALINQTPAVTLDYSAGTISPPLAPVIDDQPVTNDVTVKRTKGSSVRATLTNGNMSVQEPPAGTGRYKKNLQVAAADDQQLAALAQHLLNLGTVLGERYPTVTVLLGRASIPGNAVAPLMSAIAGVEVGDYIQITNLPFWYPQSPAKQLVLGYTEVINLTQWDITWNCTSESPWEVTAAALRRW